MNDRDPYAPDSSELSALRREEAPPPDLEARLVAAARERGLLRSAGRRVAPTTSAAGTRALLVAATLAGVFVAGRLSVTAVGPSPRDTVTVPTPPAQRFLAAVLVDSTVQARLTPETRPRLTGDLIRWAAELRSENRLVYADHLDAEGGLLVEPDGSTTPLDPFVVSDRLGGLFVIVAPDYETALATLRGSPYLEFGGRFGLIRVNPD